MYSYVEQTLVQATIEMDWDEEILIGMAIFTFDLNLSIPIHTHRLHMLFE